MTSVFFINGIFIEVTVEKFYCDHILLMRINDSYLDIPLINMSIILILLKFRTIYRQLRVDIDPNDILLTQKGTEPSTRRIFSLFWIASIPTMKEVVSSFLKENTGHRVRKWYLFTRFFTSATSFLNFSLQGHVYFAFTRRGNGD